MSLSIVRFYQGQQAPAWGLVNNGKISPLSIDCTTTKALLAYSHQQLCDAATAESLDFKGVRLLSPITDNAKVLCQGANYRQHMIDSGMDPDAKRFNMFFTKSSAAIHEPVGEIIRPQHVKLLDYEIELCLVLAQDTHTTLNVTAQNLHQYIAGICIGNDISARDVQIPQMQFHKGKSYRTFCPLGPILCLLTADEMSYLDNLQLKLAVNGQIRQSDSTRNLVFKPIETLNEFSQIANFNAGDVIMTGTPSGCALGLPSPALVRATALLPDNLRFELFNKTQARRPQYLKAGDIVESSIRSTDGKIDLGVQHHQIVST
ncbi:MAG: fumarylacetoacetate hydrolase family protein [Agitococcus sp.]|nr:fumarylacetoacetate hydrolase family protein [Agitococcus sp.]